MRAGRVAVRVGEGDKRREEMETEGQSIDGGSGKKSCRDDEGFR